MSSSATVTPHLLLTTVTVANSLSSVSDAELAPFLKNPGFLLSRVGTAVQSEFKELLRRWQIKPLHFLLLSVLQRRSGVSQQELCNQLKIDSGNMVQLLDHLEDLRLAQRDQDPADRRRHIITITAAGRDTLSAVNAAIEEMHVEFFEPLGAVEQQQLVTLLAKLYLRTPEGRREAPPVGLRATGGSE
jgi:DNA-binding MarR family transcriptional regulator